MYLSLLVTHSWIRWILLALGLFAVVRAAAGWSARKPWTRLDDRAGLLFSIAVDVQVLLGLMLYFVYSPYTARAMSDFGSAMRSSELRFWAVEHGFAAIVALVLVHVGRIRIRKTSDSFRKHRLALIFFGLALLALLAGIPWPGTPNARPLLPR